MADIKNITIDGTTYDLKDDKARNDITDLKEDLNNKIDLRTTENGVLELSFLENMTMNSTGVIYAAEGKRIAYAKVYAHLTVSFFNNSGTLPTPQICRYGFYNAVPDAGSVPSYGFNISSEQAYVEQDCYIAFTHPSVTEYYATYINNTLKKYQQNYEYLTKEALFNYHPAAYTTNNGVVGIDSSINTDSGYYKHYTKQVLPGELIMLSGVNFASSFYPFYILKNGDTIVKYYREESSENIYSTKTIFIPDGVDTIIVNDSTNVNREEKRGIFSFDANIDVMGEIVNRRFYTENNNVLWIGTSIPEGATYPYESCKANGYNCINKSLGSSKLCFENEYISGADVNKGKRLTATVAELETLYRGDVTSGIITEATLNMWKNYSYENSIIPYINGTNQTQVSMIVLDHGFNDRSTIYYQMENVDNINWDSDDRSTFTGAFKYLVDQIQKVNPFIKIVISGYFTNTVTRLSFSYNGPQICAMQQLIGEKYDISVMKAWEHTQINMKYVSGTNNYISNFNAEYGTSYSKILPDSNGNITSLQLYCPDGMHPHSDLTGNCNRRLNAVYSRLLSHMI